MDKKQLKYYSKSVLTMKGCAVSVCRCTKSFQWWLNLCNTHSEMADYAVHIQQVRHNHNIPSINDEIVIFVEMGSCRYYLPTPASVGWMISNYIKYGETTMKGLERENKRDNEAIVHKLITDSTPIATDLINIVMVYYEYDWRVDG